MDDCSHSSSMGEPNVDEREQAMGFRIGTIIVQGISEKVCMQILGQVMDFNYFTWTFNLLLATYLRFHQSHPPIPPHLPLVAPFVGSTMEVQRG